MIGNGVEITAPSLGIYHEVQSLHMDVTTAVRTKVCRPITSRQTMMRIVPQALLCEKEICSPHERSFRLSLRARLGDADRGNNGLGYKLESAGSPSKYAIVRPSEAEFSVRSWSLE